MASLLAGCLFFIKADPEWDQPPANLIIFPWDGCENRLNLWHNINLPNLLHLPKKRVEIDGFWRRRLREHDRLALALPVVVDKKLDAAEMTSAKLADGLAYAGPCLSRGE